MKREEVERLQQGDLVWTRYGRRGKQLARVVSVTSHGNVLVRRFSARRRTWTRRHVRLKPEEVLHVVFQPAAVRAAINVLRRVIGGA